MPTRKPMTGWYNPVMLVQTAIRVAVSTVFGEFADRREAMAAANAIEPQPINDSFTYKETDSDGGFWFDFLADTGDGWNSTLAMAQLVTAGSLSPGGAAEPLPRGRVLLLGGDQVYPTASKEEYDDRFLYPFDTAFEETAAKADMPDLYAVPGNHDWYDGLSAFFALFCRRRMAMPGTMGIDRPGRVIAGRPTKQTRSYFAIQLPHDWWVWGTDSQLAGYIDQPQIDYFEHVARHWMAPGSKLILMVGQPNWAYIDPAHPEREFETFSYLERLAGIARAPLTKAQIDNKERQEDQPLMGHNLKLVLTGDSHHYARYHEGGIHYVTCGGGGAFLHPTQQLEDKIFDWRYPPPGVVYRPEDSPYRRSFTIAAKADGDEALYPDRAASSKLMKGNRLFAFNNPGLTAVFFGGYLLFNWLLAMNGQILGYASLLGALSGDGGGGPLNAIYLYVRLSLVAPMPFVLFCAAMGGYYYFADSPFDNKMRAWIGLTHGAIQAGTATLITSIFLWGAGRLLWPCVEANPWCQALASPLLIIVATALAALASATIFGLYLNHHLRSSGRHWNEAFSALAEEGYKCFLRMKIDAAGKLHIHPIGLAKAPKGGGPASALKPHLIEDPIEIGS
jgi:hypothetical protein